MEDIKSFFTHCVLNFNSEQYNTQVAFSETGQLLAKYHKSHLFEESNIFNQPTTPDVEYFDTSFGVRFGMMICFDMMFAHPQLDLLQVSSFVNYRNVLMCYQMGISDIVFSTWWVNYPPLITATQVLHLFD